ncbi:glycosyltransferase family 4 protein [Burkholderia sp. BCC1993]|uniref:glycosyltransferase family 4 protein n=1 Tax=Burkholderia sp. BCC1993 TaxID=2817444 RepID=UPI002AB082D8|nr:glycosyltransferase family 4 protein [Burkholderia sp. BCC1993]
MRILFVIGNLSDYHIPRYKSFADLCVERGFEVRLIEVYGESGLYEYPQSSRDSFQRDIKYDKRTLFPNLKEGLVRGWRLLRAIRVEVSDFSPDVIVTLGYNTNYSIYLAFGKIFHGYKIIFTSDSKADDGRRSIWKEKLKGLIVSRFDGALVAGNKHRRYVKGLGIPMDRSRVGFDVIDVEMFGEIAAKAKLDEFSVRETLCLPDRYVLCVSRFIDRKNIIGVLEAFGKANERSESVCLILIGDGPLESTIRERVGALGLEDKVIMRGSVLNIEMPKYYALAEYLVLGSKYDQWGICVSEAMASGIPTIVTSTCGCADEIVIDNETGFVVAPDDVDALSKKMIELLEEASTRHKLARRAKMLIRDWSPELYATNLLDLVKVIS